MNTESLRIQGTVADDQIVWRSVYVGWAETPAYLDADDGGTMEVRFDEQVAEHLSIDAALAHAKRWAAASGFKASAPKPGYRNVFEIRLRRP